jgi:FKBP-type peptidyl-prolyl cis-trans isomerase
MKLVRITFAIMLLAAISVAQNDEMKTTDAASANAHGSGSPAAAKNAPATRPTKPKATANSFKLTDRDQRAYALGVELGLDVAKGKLDLDRDLFLQGMKDALSGNKLRMSVEDMNAVLATMQKEEREKTLAAIKAIADKNKKEGEAFLASNKAKEGVVTLPSGLQYKVLKAADGKKPGPDDKVVCNYRGTLLDGTEIDSSYKRTEASTFPLKGVIQGG